MEKIFISYRRSESGFVVGRIYDELCDEYGKDFVFKDVESLQLGMDFRDQISEKLKNCNVLLAVISSNWLNLKDDTGDIRIHNPNDWVRIEIEEALKRKIPVIPILIDTTKPLEESLLPNSLKPLAFRQSKRLRPDPDFNNDMKDLIGHINNIVTVNLENKDTHRDNKPSKKGINYIYYTLLAISLTVSVSIIYRVSTTIENPRTVYIQYYNDSSKRIMSDFQNELQMQGFKAFGAEKMNFKFKNMIKYFNSNDLNDATKLLSATKKFFSDEGCPIDVIELVPANSIKSNQPLEVWLNHGCK